MDTTGVPNRFSVTNLLVLANIAMFGLQQLLGPRFTDPLSLWPMQESPFGEGSLFHSWQLLTYGFLHGGWTHLFFNMFGLYTIGMRVEERFGAKRYLFFYLVCVVGAAAFHMIVNTVAHLPYGPALGASGGLFGVLLAFGMEFPRERLMLMFLPIPIPAWLFVTLYGLAELYFGVTQTLQGVGHFAHLGGMLTGFVMILFWRQQRQHAPR
jgi:membrane associated rhomboid family serine protease